MSRVPLNVFCVPAPGPFRAGSVVPLAGLLAVLLALAGCGDGATPQAPRPHVLLISIDTLRADHVGSYGYRLPTTPAIDALAARGTRFADMTVTTPKTWPAVASLLTGTVPRTHGVRLQNRVLPAEGDAALPVIAELLRAEGYRTAGIVTNYNLLANFGYGRGFDHYVEAWEEAWDEMHKGKPLPDDPLERLKQLFGSAKMRALFQRTDAKLVTDRALDWLEQDPTGEQPFFLWLHYMDPHGPYDPPPSHATLFEGEYPVEEVPYAELKGPHLTYEKGADGKSAPVTDLGFYKARYDREIRSLDDQLARLFDALEQRGLADDTLVVLTADHGEALGSHDYYFEHGLQPYEECARVPFIVAWPQVLPTGQVVEQPVSLLDVAPTLLELAGVAPPESMEGVSLAPFVRGEPDARAPEQVFMESGDDRFTDREMQVSVRQGQWKLVFVPDPEDQQRLAGQPVELYDLSQDPSEQHEVSADNPRVVQKLLADVQRWKREHPVGGGLSEEDFLEGLDDRSRAFLQAMGYIDLPGDGSPVPPGDPDGANDG